MLWKTAVILYEAQNKGIGDEVKPMKGSGELFGP